MKVVINVCYGGFGLSPAAVKRMAELQGRECYFFINDLTTTFRRRYVPATQEEASSTIMWHAFDIPNPNEVLMNDDDWHKMTDADKQASHELYDKHALSDCPERTDPLLIRVIEELGAGHGTGASGRFAELKIVEIPDDVAYDIEEYDGFEHIAEVHRTWG